MPLPSNNLVTIATLLAIAISVLLGLDGGVIYSDFKLGDPLKTTSNILVYVGLASTSEITLRCSSFVGGLCGYAMTLLNVDGINWFHFAIQTPLMLLAFHSTYSVVTHSCIEYRFTARELDLYNTQFVSYGLTKHEFLELLQAGAEWKTIEDEGVPMDLTQQGESVQSFCLITKGVFVVVADGEEVATLGPGALGKLNPIMQLHMYSVYIHVRFVQYHIHEASHVQYRHFEKTYRFVD